MLADPQEAVNTMSNSGVVGVEKYAWDVRELLKAVKLMVSIYKSVLYS